MKDLLKMENVVNAIMPKYNTGLHGQSAAKVLGDPHESITLAAITN